MRQRRAGPTSCLLLLAGATLLPPAARAQDYLPAAIGGAIGMGAGGYVALGIVALKARHGQYLFGLDDVLGWESGAVLAGTGTGVALGLWDQERLRHAVYGAMGGALLGTVVGVLVGRERWDPPEGKWAGGVIGGAAGILVGTGIGALWPPDPGGDGGGAVIPVTVRIPLGR